MGPAAEAEAMRGRNRNAGSAGTRRWNNGRPHTPQVATVNAQDPFPRPDGSTSTATQRIAVETQLLVQCWCQEAFVKVPRSHVLRGLTGTCRRSGCKPS